MIKEIYLDTETTGFRSDDQVIQIGIIDQDGNILLDSLIQCDKEIPEDAYAIHGISNEMLADAPTFSEVYPKIKAIIEDAERVNIYNSSFDVRLLHQTCETHQLENFNYKKSADAPVYFTKINCVMTAYANMFFDGTWIKLGEACGFEKIDCSDLKAHDAVSDCEMTRRLHISMKQYEEKAKKRQEYRNKLKQQKLELVPEDTSGFPDFGQAWRPDGYKTLSQLTKRDLKKFEFAGTCCSTYGDRGYLFKPKENTSE